ncbi:hypothetical protein OOI97_21085, partial [Providencia stuartii]|nr:hypothetical protein [Providencia stuartii]
LSEQECFDYAVNIDECVKSAVAEFSINPSEIENQIRLKLLPLLVRDAGLGLDAAKLILADIIQITRLGVAGHH